MLHWRLTWSRYAPDYLPEGVTAGKFLTARQAAQRIPDQACVFSSGIAGNARCTPFYLAIRERFQREGHPRNLTWVNAGAQGSRGRVPGTVEELGLPGLLKLYLAGHLETARAQLQLAASGQLEVHTLPQGVIALLLEQFAAGRRELCTGVGAGTFLDPRCGRGSIVNPPASTSFVRAEGAGLCYTMPRPDVALFSAPYADREGNIYFHDAATITENLPSLRAVKRLGGRAMVTVSGLIPTDPDRVSVPASEVDHIVVNPYNEQTASVLQRAFWPVFTPQAEEEPAAAMDRLGFINDLLGITPRRDAVNRLMSRIAASLFREHVPPDSLVNIGVGLPEEVVRLLLHYGLAQQYTFTTEAGSFGGLPAPGVFFGAAIRPQHLESSSTMFERYRQGLEAAVLGFLELDAAGNVNASRRSEEVSNYVGPGGFPDISYYARTLIFIGSWMNKGRLRLNNGRVVVERAGEPKCVDRLKEVTFRARPAWEAGKKVFYITDLGLFTLGKEGLQLALRYPGIDIGRDMLAHASAALDLGQAEEVPTLDRDWVNGEGLLNRGFAYS